MDGRDHWSTGSATNLGTVWSEGISLHLYLKLPSSFRMKVKDGHIKGSHVRTKAQADFHVQPCIQLMTFKFLGF